MVNTKEMRKLLKEYFRALDELDEGIGNKSSLEELHKRQELMNVLNQLEESKQEIIELKRKLGLG